MKIFLFIFFLLVLNSYACQPNFPYKDGWLGGDAVYSIPISKTKDLWLFGDTFIGKNRRDAAFINNSIAVSECKGNKWNLDYIWKESRTGPRSFFEDIEQGFKLWPKDGFIHRGVLTIFFTRVKTIPGPIGLNFEVFDTVAIQVLNPYDSPKNWVTKQKDFLKGSELIGGTAVFKKDKYLYQFASQRDLNGSSPMVLIRSALNNIWEDLEIFQDENWVKYNPNKNLDETYIILRGAQEVSLSWNSSKGIFEMIIPGNMLSGGANLWTSARLIGEWKNQGQIIKYPEVSQSIPGVFCYAAKFHPRFTIYTYVCNSLDEATILDNLEIYRPIIISN